MGNYKIGIFDSGLGGLSITKELIKQFPNVDFLYVADTKNCPYGTKTKKQIENIVSRMVTYLINENVDAIVVACNTASANSDHLDLLIPVIKMIEPTCIDVVKRTKTKNVLLLATEATLNSKKYNAILDTEKINVFEVSCKELVSLVEKGKQNTKESFSKVYNIIYPYFGKNIDTVILGCTHLGFLKDELYKSFDGKVELADGINEITQIVKKSKWFETTTDSKAAGSLKLITTGDFDTFKKCVDKLQFRCNIIKKETI